MGIMRESQEIIFSNNKKTIEVEENGKTGKYI